MSVVIYHKNRFLLVERAKDPGRGMHAFPGGKAETGETLEDAARRELIEETGLRVHALRPLVEVMIPEAGGGFHLHVFLAEYFVGMLTAGDDALTAGWYSLDEMNALTMPQSVRDVALMVAGASIPNKTPSPKFYAARESITPAGGNAARPRRIL